MSFYEEIDMIINALERAKHCKRLKQDYEPDLTDAFTALDKLLFDGDLM